MLSVMVIKSGVSLHKTDASKCNDSKLVKCFLVYISMQAMICVFFIDSVANRCVTLSHIHIQNIYTTQAVSPLLSNSKSFHTYRLFFADIG